MNESADISLELRRQIAAAAQGYLDGRIKAVETSRRIFEASIQLDASTSDLLMGLTAVASDSDGFPLGAERDHWSPAALQREDAARQQYELAVTARMTHLCRQVVDLFASETHPDSPSATT